MHLQSTKTLRESELKVASGINHLNISTMVNVTTLYMSMVHKQDLTLNLIEKKESSRKNTQKKTMFPLHCPGSTQHTDRFWPDSNLNPQEVAILCHIHSLMLVGFFMYLFMNDFLPGCLFAVVI